MNREYFTDNISVETMAKLIDETLTLERNNKNKKIKPNILKAVSAIAAILLVIGLANFIPLINFSGGADEIIPGAFFVRDGAPSGIILTDIPRIIEKSVFDNLLERIPEERGRALAKMRAYYSIKNINGERL